MALGHHWLVKLICRSFFLNWAYGILGGWKTQSACMKHDIWMCVFSFREFVQQEFAHWGVTVVSQSNSHIITWYVYSALGMEDRVEGAKSMSQHSLGKCALSSWFLILKRRKKRGLFCTTGEMVSKVKNGNKEKINAGALQHEANWIG